MVWAQVDSPVAPPPPVVWEPVSDSDERDPSLTAVSWQIVPGSEEQDQPSTMVVWELLETDDLTVIPSSETASGSEINPPSSLEEAEALLSTIPLQPSD